MQSDVSVRRQPLLQNSRVAGLVGSPAPDLVLDGLQGPIESGGILVLEEGIDLVDSSGVSEAAQAGVDEAVDNDGVANLGDDGIPVRLDVLPLQRSADVVVRQRAGEDVHVSAGDGVGGRGGVEVEGDDGGLEELGVLDETENAEAEKLAVNGLGVEPLVLEDLDDTSGVLVDGRSPDRHTKRGVDGVRLWVLGPGVEALVGLLRNPDDMLVFMFAWQYE